MNINEFLIEQDEDSFPHEYGCWINEESFDPPFLQKELNEMRKLGLIQRDRNKRFRLTMKASQLWSKMKKPCNKH